MSYYMRYKNAPVEYAELRSNHEALAIAAPPRIRFTPTASGQIEVGVCHDACVDECFTVSLSDIEQVVSALKNGVSF